MRRKIPFLQEPVPLLGLPGLLAAPLSARSRFADRGTGMGHIAGVLLLNVKVGEDVLQTEVIRLC